MNNSNYILFQQAKELTKKGKYKDATQILRQINQNEPNDNIVKFELAKLLAKNKYTKGEAEKIFKELINIGSPNDRTYAMLELGRLYASIGKTNEAEKSFKELLNTQNRTYAMLELGRLYASIGKTNEAEKSFKELLNTQSRTYAMLELGRLYASIGKTNEAEKSFKELLNTQSRTYALLELGRLYASIGKTNEAEKSFKELIISNAQNRTYAMLELGRLYASIGKTNEAEKSFKELLNTQSRTYALLELGRLYASNGNEKLARKIFLEILTLENNEYAIKQLIYLDIKNNNLEEILDLLMKLSIQDKEDKEYHMIKSYVLYKLGKKEKIEAKNYYTQQLMNYDEYAALEHIKKHLDENENKRLHTVFDSSIDLQQLFEQAKEKIKVINPTEFTIVEKYIICFEEDIGISEGEKVKTIEVITIPHTKNILTMYPIKVINFKKGKQFRIELEK